MCKYSAISLAFSFVLFLKVNEISRCILRICVFNLHRIIRINEHQRLLLILKECGGNIQITGKQFFFQLPFSPEYDIKVNMKGIACHIYVAYNLIQREKWYMRIIHHHATERK